MKRVTIVAMLAASLTACGSEPAPLPGGPSAADPQVGWVRIEGVPIPQDDDVRVWKRCDGSAMLYVTDGYNSGGVAAVPNSPECAP